MPKGSKELTEARKEEIMNACLKLYETENFRDITIRDIGNMTSFGRTSVYNYFQTKEEIFLAILQKEYEAWIADLEHMMDEHESMDRNQLAEGLASAMARRELLLKVMSMNHFDMEENSREERLTDFKRAYGKSLRTVEKCLERYCPEMDNEARQRFIYAFFPFIYGIYPYTYVTEKQKKAMDEAEVEFAYHSVYEITLSFLKSIFGIM